MAAHPPCDDVRPLIALLPERGLSRRDRIAAHEHLVGCAGCEGPVGIDSAIGGVRAGQRSDDSRRNVVRGGAARAEAVHGRAVGRYVESSEAASEVNELGLRRSAAGGCKADQSGQQ